ncbi:MAG: FMN-binding protein [Clostridiales Family XIII bacterium]|nr:FMN-binding protein [Clostridiales Family XIII bacterium]
MTKLEIFQKLNPEITKIKILREGEDIVGWELLKNDEALGYGFIMKAPDSALDVPDTEEFDIYEVTGIIDPEFRIRSLDIVLHEDYHGDLWAEEIVETAYRDQYVGLASDQVGPAPEGSVDAISGSTISSDAVVSAVRKKLEKFESIYK